MRGFLKKSFAVVMAAAACLTFGVGSYIEKPVSASDSIPIETEVSVGKEVIAVPEPTDAPITTENTTTTTTSVTTDITTTIATSATTIPTIVSTTQFAIYESGYVHSLKSPPDKTVYEIGDELDLTGLKVDLVFYDQQGGRHTIYRDAYPPYNPDFIVDTSDFDNSKAGTYKIKVSCADKFAAFFPPGPVYFEVTVNDSSTVTTTTSASSTDITITTETTVVTTSAPIVTSTIITSLYQSAYHLDIHNLPNKTDYNIGDKLDLTGLTVDLWYNDAVNRYYDININAYPPDYPDVFIIDASDFDNSKAGTYIIKIICKDDAIHYWHTLWTYFKVTVNDSSLTTTTTSTSSTENTTTATAEILPVTLKQLVAKDDTFEDNSLIYSDKYKFALEKGADRDKLIVYGIPAEDCYGDWKSHVKTNNMDYTYLLPPDWFPAGAERSVYSGLEYTGVSSKNSHFQFEKPLNILFFTNDEIPYLYDTVEEATKSYGFDISKYIYNTDVQDTVTLGDVDRNGEIDIFDAVIVAKYTVKKLSLDDEQLKLADMDSSGEVDIFDAVAIAKKNVEK